MKSYIAGREVRIKRCLRRAFFPISRNVQKSLCSTPSIDMILIPFESPHLEERLRYPSRRNRGLRTDSTGPRSEIRHQKTHFSPIFGQFFTHSDQSFSENQKKVTPGGVDSLLRIG